MLASPGSLDRCVEGETAKLVLNGAQDTSSSKTSLSSSTSFPLHVRSLQAGEGDSLIQVVYIPLSSASTNATTHNKNNSISLVMDLGLSGSPSPYFLFPPCSFFTVLLIILIPLLLPLFYHQHSFFISHDPVALQLIMLDSILHLSSLPSHFPFFHLHSQSSIPMSLYTVFHRYWYLTPRA